MSRRPPGISLVDCPKQGDSRALRSKLRVCPWRRRSGEHLRQHVDLHAGVL
jgi:hypothetical protein